MRFLLPLSISVISGCADWPLHENIEFDHDGLPAGLSESETLSEILDWSEPLDEDEVNDYSRIGGSLYSGTGWQLEGVLSGISWDNDATPTPSTSDCDEPLAFPPSINIEGMEGSYAGDIEWIGMVARGRGTLCASLDLSDQSDEDMEGIRYDLLLYKLNACGEPIQIRVDEDLMVLGLSSSGVRTDWSTGVEEDEVLGLVLAGYAPNDLDMELSWRLAISLIDIPTDGICPTLPWN
jgi:hypothetical protein